MLARKRILLLGVGFSCILAGEILGIVEEIVTPTQEMHK